MGECFITRRGGGGGTGLPKFTYNGQYTLIDDGGGDWRIKFLTSGVLTFTKLGNAKDGIDLFLVGGGGGGAQYTLPVDNAGGGGGGYTLTKRALSVAKGTAYQITVGAGGAGGASTGVTGGTTSAFSASAAGGQGAQGRNGGNGGSGGGGGSRIRSDTDSSDRLGKGGNGGSDGSNGASGTESWNGENGTGGTGQGTTTREFGESTGTLYSGGGGGAGHNGDGTGGDGGGGAAHAYSVQGVSGTANLGGGGGAGRAGAGSGGSGIVIIRNVRLAITQQPQDASVDTNASAIFTVKAVGAGLTYQWQFLPAADGSAWSNTNASGATTASLTIVGASYRNGYKYRCIVTDKKGRQVTSDAATLTVTA